VSAAGQANIVVIDGSPQGVPILNWISTVRGSNPVPGGAGLGPTSPVGLNYNFNGPMRSIDYFGNSHSVFIEQQLGSNLFIELAGFHNALDNIWVREGGGGGALSVDANRLLPNGSPNPNAGQIYTEGTIRPQVQERLAEEVFPTNLISPLARAGWASIVWAYCSVSAGMSLPSTTCRRLTRLRFPATTPGSTTRRT